jgi:hypothetical protein
MMVTMGSFAVALFLFGILVAVRTAFSQGVDTAGVDRLIVVNRSSIIQPLPYAYRDRLAKIPGVTLVSYASWFGGVYQNPNKGFQGVFQAPIDPVALQQAPIVGRWGPGTGGDPTFSSLDPNIKRPYSDTMTIGIEAHPAAGIRLQFAGVGKWEKDLLGVVNRSTAAPVYATVGIPDPDLVIRSSGEKRISNFLLWQLAYAEMYFTPVLWPDFDRRQFEQALVSYAGRQRRFGLTGDQIEAARHA